MTTFQNLTENQPQQTQQTQQPQQMQRPQQPQQPQQTQQTQQPQQMQRPQQGYPPAPANRAVTGDELLFYPIAKSISANMDSSNLSDDLINLYFGGLDCQTIQERRKIVLREMMFVYNYLSTNNKNFDTDKAKTSDPAKVTLKSALLMISQVLGMGLTFSPAKKFFHIGILSGEVVKQENIAYFRMKADQLGFKLHAFSVTKSAIEKEKIKFSISSTGDYKIISSDNYFIESATDKAEVGAYVVQVMDNKTLKTLKTFVFDAKSIESRKKSTNSIIKGAELVANFETIAVKKACKSILNVVDDDDYYIDPESQVSKSFEYLGQSERPKLSSKINQQNKDLE